MMMHFEDKQAFIAKAAVLLNSNGRFVLSIDKNPADHIDMGSWQLNIYPDKPEMVAACVQDANMRIERQFETEFAHVFVCLKIG